MPSSRINGVRIHWEMAGDAGEPLVLVHGSWGDHRNWASVAPALARSFRVLTYDRRGHSRSERPPGQGSVRDDVTDLAALLEERRLAPAHIVGSSFGASIVLRLAGTRPELFRSLVAHEPPLFALLEDEPDTRGALTVVRERMSAVVSLLAAGDPTGGARRFVETIVLGPGAWSELPDATKETFVVNAPTWLDEMHDPEALEIELGALSALAAPALLTSGDQSPPFFRAIVDRIASAMPTASSWTYAGAGHVPHQSHPEEYARVVSEFVTSPRA